MPHGISTSASVQPGMEVEQRAQQQQRGSRGPCLGTRGRRERHGDRGHRRGVAGEDLGQAVLEVRRRLENRGGDRARRLAVAVAREAGGDQRVLVGPDGPGVVAERVVAGLVGAEGAHAPAGVELLVEQPLGGRGRLVLVEQARPQQMADVGGQAVDLALLAVQREGVAATLGHPEVVAEALAQDRLPGARGARRAPDRPTPRGPGGRERRRAS